MNDRQKLKDDTYLKVANNISQLSKDKNTKIGAIIVGEDGTPVSWGYNGTVQGFNDALIPHDRKKKELGYIENGETITFTENKYPFMEHAERNALDFADPSKLKGSTLYVTAPPCVDCALRIAKRKISRVVIDDAYMKDSNSSIGAGFEKSKFIFTEANIDLYIGNNKIKLERISNESNSIFN
jgi:dCMP deaminase